MTALRTGVGEMCALFSKFSAGSATLAGQRKVLALWRGHTRRTPHKIRRCPHESPHSDDPESPFEELMVAEKFLEL